jgi:hypothetical protein
MALSVWKTFSTFSHQRNENQNYTEIPSHSSQNGCHQENKQEMLQGCGKKEPLNTVGRNVN